jgi:hypothetical protein
MKKFLVVISRPTGGSDSSVFPIYPALLTRPSLNSIDQLLSHNINIPSAREVNWQEDKPIVTSCVHVTEDWAIFKKTFPSASAQSMLLLLLLPIE